MTKKPNYKATVIIPSYQSKKFIFRALESISKQKTDFAYEIIVVDSTGDDTAELVQQRFPDIQVVKLPERAYPGTARNVAIQMATGEYLAFTDTDCVVDVFWLQRLVDSHRRGYPVVGGMVRNGTPWNVFGTVDYLLEFSALITPRETTTASHFGTCNVSFDTRIFQTHGLFIDQVKGSDSLYCRMVKAKGTPLFHQPQAVIWHHNRTNLKKIFRNQFELGYGAAINRHRYHLSGEFFIKFPVLIPLLPFVRAAAIAKRLLFKSPPDFIKFIVLSPLILAGLIFHMLGFIHGRKVVLAMEQKNEL